MMINSSNWTVVWSCICSDFMPHAECKGERKTAKTWDYTLTHTDKMYFSFQQMSRISSPNKSVYFADHSLSHRSDSCNWRKWHMPACICPLRLYDKVALLEIHPHSALNWILTGKIRSPCFLYTSRVFTVVVTGHKPTTQLKALFS